MSNYLDMSDTESTPPETKIIVAIKPPRTRKTIELPCEKCGKIMKSQKSYDAHVKLQVCYKPDEITYCKTCDITLANNTDYTRHLLSINHINAIGCDKLELLQHNEPAKILIADPYLTENEARNIGTTNLGNQYVLRFANNQSQTIKLTHNPKSHPESESSNQAAPDSSTRTNSPTTSTQSDHMQPDPVRDYHIKMIKYIDSHAKTIDEKRAALLKVLSSNVAIENFKGFQSFLKMTIKDANLLAAYGNAINEFINVLVKERASGHKEYKGKDINKFVLLLSS